MILRLLSIWVSGCIFTAPSSGGIIRCDWYAYLTGWMLNLMRHRETDEMEHVAFCIASLKGGQQ